MMDGELWANELTSLLVSMVDSDPMLRGGELRTDEVRPPLVSILDRDSVSGDDKSGDVLKPPRISVLDRDPVSGDDEVRGEVKPPFVSVLDGDSVPGDDEVGTDKLTSLILGKRSSLVEVLKTSGLDEDTMLLGESTISVGVI